MNSTTQKETLLTLSGVNKAFGNTQALNDIDLTFESGTIHALVGENGAGKSTLGKILIGAHQPNSGLMRLQGNTVTVRTPAQGNEFGLVGIAQELSLLPSRTVADNISLGGEITRGPFVEAKATKKQVLDLMDRYGMRLDPDVTVGSLPVPEQQKVEILRALNRNARLIVFDEPTARLASDDAEQLLNLVRELAASGTAIVYVSHFLDEVLAVADTVTILRNGKLVRTRPIENETRDTLIEGVTGIDVQEQFPPLKPIRQGAPAVLSVSSLSKKGVFSDINFNISAGEILGFAGLVGAGRSEIAHAIYRAAPADEGQIVLHDKDLSKAEISDCVDQGIAMIPESRRDQGVFLNRPILENTSLPHLGRFGTLFGLNKRSERDAVESHCNISTVKHGGLNKTVATLSGGNQQKILFARASLGAPDLLIADEPTRGVDVGAKRSIYELIVTMAANQKSVMLISSEIEEILGLCHRVLVISRGRITAELSGTALTQDALMKAAFKGH